MNFKKFHESKNLFDKDNIIDGGDFFVDGVKITASQNTDILLIPCKPNTYYTVSRSVILGRFAIGFVTSSTLYADMPVSNSRQNDGATYLTSFSDSDSTYLVVYYAKHAGSGSNTETEIQSCLDTLMVNEGSSAESYEPYSSEVWHDIPHYIHKTDTDILTTLPDVVYVNDTTATVGLKGQMEQSGTPTPSSPIQPQECGERTENLCNPIPYKNNYYINENGVETQFSGFDIYKVAATAQTKYSLSLNTSLSGSTVRIHSYSNDSWTEQIVTPTVKTLPITFTTPQDCDEIRFSITNNALNHIMLNEGSTALPYEPYGYKIPILNNSQTTNVYLGEVQTTRQIKKLVLTGNEAIYPYSFQNTNGVEITPALDTTYMRTNGICTHYPVATSGVAHSVWLGVNNKTIYMVSILDDLGISTVPQFKAFLAAQYAAGTPVTVWYVLATETTGIVNEPIRKIGDYADSLTTTIPTIAGANTLSIGTALQPSEVTANYHGWHPVQSVHEAENGAWT